MAKLMNDLEKDFFKFYKIAVESGDVASWQAALDKVKSAEQSTAIEDAVGYIITGASALPPVLNAINKAGLTYDQIKTAISMGSKIGAITASEVDFDKIEKFASDYKRFNRENRNTLLKQAGILDSISSGISKIMPYVSIVYKAIVAIKNLYTGFNAYSEIVKESDEFGLKWYETLIPGKIDEKVKQNESNASAMGSLGYICQMAINLIKNGLTALIKSIAVAEELFVMILKAMLDEEGAAIKALGIAEWVISGILFILEIGGGAILSMFHSKTLKEIKKIIKSHIPGSEAEAEEKGLFGGLTSLLGM